MEVLIIVILLILFLFLNNRTKIEGFEVVKDEGEQGEEDEGEEDEEDEGEGDEGVEGEEDEGEGDEGAEGEEEEGAEEEEEEEEVPLIHHDVLPYSSYKLHDELKVGSSGEVDSVDKNHFGCFRRKDAVITKDSGDVIKGSMCNEKWGIPECMNQSPNKIIQSILDQPKINPLRGYHQDSNSYSLDYIHYLNDEPIPINTTFFS